jgi:hypothetical protein
MRETYTRKLAERIDAVMCLMLNRLQPRSGEDVIDRLDLEQCRKGVSQEWREDKGDLGGFCSLSAGRSWDGADEDFMADGPHLFKERFEFTVLSNGLLEELGLLSR